MTFQVLLVFPTLIVFLYQQHNNVIHAQMIPGPGEKCKWKENVTDITEEPQHRYMILEECLYYSLAEKSDKTFEKPNSLVVLPPTDTNRDQILVSFKKMSIRQIWMNEVWKEMHLTGYAELGWRDTRMRWDVNTWKIDTLAIKSYGHLWMPDIFSGRYGTAGQSQDFTVFKDIQARNTGDISARLEFRMQAVCEINYEEFPNDKQFCCFYMHSQLFSKIIRFKLNRTDGVLDPDQLQSNWDVKFIRLGVDERSDSSQVIRTCMQTSRRSSTLRLELTLPVVISAILVVIAPLFGSFRQQLYVKLFALLLQFLCFQFLVTRTPQLGIGDLVPRIYRFYEFTLAMTIVSVFITLIFAALSRIQRKLPPPHRLTLITSAVNSRLCCFDKNEDPDLPSKHITTVEADYAADWREVYGFGNNVTSVMLMIAYIVGVLVLCT